jgi:Ca-activated chloride channel family protein
MSDGLANVGPHRPSDFERLGQRLGAQGITVTTVGLGRGYNEDLMAGLASASDGNHAFAHTPRT